MLVVISGTVDSWIVLDQACDHGSNIVSEVCANQGADASLILA
jgi:hypothetical protein